MYVGSAVDSPKSWGISQYLPGQTGQYMPVNANTSSPDYASPHVEPPPAHSGKNKGRVLCDETEHLVLSNQSRWPEFWSL